MGKESLAMQVNTTGLQDNVMRAPVKLVHMVNTHLGKKGGIQNVFTAQQVKLFHGTTLTGVGTVRVGNIPPMGALNAISVQLENIVG
jgi:hypothetical protein